MLQGALFWKVKQSGDGWETESRVARNWATTSASATQRSTSDSSLRHKLPQHCSSPSYLWCWNCFCVTDSLKLPLHLWCMSNCSECLLHHPRPWSSISSSARPCTDHCTSSPHPNSAPTPCAMWRASCTPRTPCLADSPSLPHEALAIVFASAYRWFHWCRRILERVRYQKKSPNWTSPNTRKLQGNWSWAPAVIVLRSLSIAGLAIITHLSTNRSWQVRTYCVFSPCTGYEIFIRLFPS